SNNTCTSARALGRGTGLGRLLMSAVSLPKLPPVTGNNVANVLGASPRPITKVAPLTAFKPGKYNVTRFVRSGTIGPRYWSCAPASGPSAVIVVLVADGLNCSVSYLGNLRTRLLL